MPNARLLELLGHEPHTPLYVAVHATVTGLGCLPTSSNAADTAGAFSHAAAQR